MDKSVSWTWSVWQWSLFCRLSCLSHVATPSSFVLHMWIEREELHANVWKQHETTKDLLKTSEDVLRIIMNYKEVQYIRLVHISSIEQRSASKNVCESWNSVHLGQTALVVVHATPLSFMLLYGPVKCRKATFGYVTPPMMVIVPIVIYSQCSWLDLLCWKKARNVYDGIELRPPTAGHKRSKNAPRSGKSVASAEQIVVIHGIASPTGVTTFPKSKKSGR